MKKILFIPAHAVEGTIRCRAIQLARYLSERHNVKYLTWSSDFTGSLAGRAKNMLSDFFRRSSVFSSEKITMVRLPVLRRPLSVAGWFNERSTVGWIERNGIEVVVSASVNMFPVPARRRFRYIFDFHDLPTPETETVYGRYKMRFVDREAAKADAVTACSAGLKKWAENRYRKQAYLVPNGVDLEQIRKVSAETISEVRKRYNLEGKFVIGCIGHLGPWMNLEFVHRVFKKFSGKFSDSVLFMVGPVTGFKPPEGDNVIYTGPVSPAEVDRYFHVLDVGLLPKIIDPSQNMAFHIKIIEYTAVKKPVLSSPLDEIKRLNWPNILVADYNEEKWLENLCAARRMPWKKEWDNLVSAYDWQIICRGLDEIIEKL